jgi:hypothetical protein
VTDRPTTCARSRGGSPSSAFRFVLPKRACVGSVSQPLRLNCSDRRPVERFRRASPTCQSQVPRLGADRAQIPAERPLAASARTSAFPALSCQSGRRDLNSGPLVPQTSALTRLRHAPSDATLSKALIKRPTCVPADSKLIYCSPQPVLTASKDCLPKTGAGTTYSLGAGGCRPRYDPRPAS